MAFSADDFIVSESIEAAVVDIDSRVDPPSLQASATTKKAYRAALSCAVAANTSRYFTHDVSVTLTWIITEERRYQTHVVSDLDNVLKTTIDALAGPKGVLIDDNQVQSIQASWNTGLGRDDGGFLLRVEALRRDDFLSRGGTFVQITPARCFYVPAAPPHHQRRYVDQLVWMNEKREALEAEGFPKDELHFVTPQSRSFPRARLSRFEVLLPGEFI